MKNRIGRSTGAFNWRTFVLLLAGLALGCVGRAATQTLTILGANGVPGSVEPNTDYSKDGGVTWHPAYLFTGHPWGYIPGTNAWLNQDPSPFVGLNERVDFRVRFYAPSTWTNAQMTYTVNADNEADILLNGTLIAHTIGGETSSSGTIPTQYLVPGLNILYVRLIDYGGWVGLNYRINLSMEADSPLQLLTPPPSITSPLTATDTVNGPFNYTITATNSPTSFAASNLPPGLTINPANGVISGAPTAAGTYNILLSASSVFGTGSNTLVLSVNKTPAGVTLGSLTQTYDGTAKSATAATSPAGLPVAFTYTGANLPPVNAGSYGVIGVIDSPAYIGSATGTLLINPAPATIVLGNLAQAYDGSPKTVSITTTPAGLSTSTTYNGSATAPTAVGSYAVAATVANPNYTGSASGTLTISDTTKPVLTLPTSPIVVEATSSAGATVTFTATANDNVNGVVPVTLTPASGSLFPIGATTVTATATDAAGNTATGTFTVKVHSLTITADKPTVTVDEGATATNSGTFNDSDAVTVTVSASKGAIAQTATGAWTYQQTLSPGGHPIELSLDSDDNLYVVDENNTVYKYDSSGALVTTWTVGGAPKGIAVDNLNHVVYVVSTGNNRVEKYTLTGTLISTIGTTGGGNGQFSNPYCVAVDSAGNVYVTDTGNARIEVFNSSGTFLRKWGGAGGGDGQFNFNQGIRVSASGRVYVADRNNYRVQYFDTNGNFLGKWGTSGSGAGQFNQPAGVGIDPSGNVYVGDIFNGRVQKFTADGTFVDQFGPGTGPGMLNQPHGTVFPQAGRSIYIASWASGVVQKYTTPGTWSWSYTAPVGSVGSSTVNVTATNANGIVATTSFNLVVRDATPPTLTLPANQTLEATGPAGASATFAATATDAVTASPTIAYSKASGSVFPLGTTAVTVTATDAAGNVATGTFTITVRDTVAPTIAPLRDLTTEATGTSGAVVTFGTTASDTVSGNVAVTASPASGSTFPLGTTLVTLHATDGAGNVGSSTFTVKVVDTTAPVITPPAPIVAEATSAAGAAVTFNPTANDLADGAVTVTASPASGSTFPLGATTVSLTATDLSGNVANSSFTVTVADTTAPVLTLPASQTLEAASAAGAIATFAASATDAVGATITYSAASGSTFPLGATTVNVTATDAAGNHSSGAFTITVRDTTPPVIDVPANIVTEATGAAGAVATFSTSATDLVDGNVAVASSIASGSTFALGTTPITLTATDAAGNTATKVFSVTVTDTTAPVIAPQDNLIVEATSADGAVVAFTPSALDIVSGAVAVNATPASGSTFPLGTTPVQLVAHDAAGNAAGSSFTVTVQDTTPPTIATPANIVAEATSAAGAVVNFSPTASDLVDGAVSVTASPASGSTFPLGTTAVTLTSTDAHGNTATSTFTVTVQDTTAPVLTTPGNQTLEATGPAGAAATFLASATDAVGASIAYSIAPGSTFPLGTTTVTVIASDAAHNSTSGTFTITVRDTTRPVLSLPASQILEATAATGAVATFSATANDLVSGNLPVSFSPASGNRFALGTTPVTASATDAAANTATGMFTITVRDTTPPVITAPADLVEEATGPSGAVATFTATATDIVDGTDAVTASTPSGSTFALGTTTVTLTATDAAQNTSTKTFDVTVQDTTAPTINVPADIIVDSPTVLGSVVTFTVTASDIVDGSRPVTLSQASGSTFPVGTTTVTATATDAAGNIATRSFNVTVRAPATAAVNQITALNGTINGSIQQLDDHGVTLNGSGAITGELLVVGTPAVRLNGKPGFGGTADFTGSASPSNYTITLNGGASLGRLIRRVDPVALPVVAAPANPTGSRSVTMNKSTDAIGAWATVRNLTLNGNAGNVAVPAGTYGNFTANGKSGFTLGVAGATTPAVYEFQNLTLNGNTTFNIVGPVIVTVKNTIDVNGSMGNDAHPEWFDLRISDGSLTLNGNVSVHAYVVAPKGTVTINGNSELRGGLAADKLVLNGNSELTLLLR